MAQRANPQKKVFPNFARGEGDFPEVNAGVRAALEEAGCEVCDLKTRRGEVATTLVGFAHRWTFKRAWYYYIADGPGVPPDVAEAFHQEWGTQCRVDGHCCCPSPLEWFEGFAVGAYHIDTQEGLNAFVKMLATVHKPKVEDESV